MMLEENVTLSKRLVFSVVIALVLCVTLINIAWWKETRPMTDCPGGQLDLTGRGIITTSQMDEQVMRVTLEKRPGQMEVLTVDVCNGKILSELSIETDPGISAE